MFALRLKFQYVGLVSLQSVVWRLTDGIPPCLFRPLCYL